MSTASDAGKLDSVNSTGLSSTEPTVEKSRQMTKRKVSRQDYQQQSVSIGSI